MATWLVKKDGRMFGPFDADQIRRLVESGKLDDDSLVRAGDSGPWERISHVRKFLSGEPQDVENDESIVPPMLRSSAGNTSITSGLAGEFCADHSLSSLEASLDDALDRAVSSQTSQKSNGGKDSVSEDSSQATSARRPNVSATPKVKNSTADTVPSRRPSKASPKPIRPSQIADVRKTRDIQYGNATLAGVLSVVPGVGHIYLGMKQVGLCVMAVVPTLYLVCWLGGLALARLCINADIQPTAEPQSAAGRLIAKQSATSVGMSFLVATVVVCLCLPLLAHVGTVIHAAQSAEE